MWQGKWREGERERGREGKKEKLAANEFGSGSNGVVTGHSDTHVPATSSGKLP